jgi:multiple sugar transport system substrate-binding protein
MVEINLSVMLHTPRTPAVLQSLLEQFEAQHHIHVKLTALDWSISRAELNKAAFNRQGLDVSEVGTSWIGDLFSMNSLRPFSPAEAHHLGPPEEFIDASWKAGLVTQDTRQWAIPWLVDAFAVHYRKDLFEQAGIDPQTAFQSHAGLDQAAQLLQRNGVEIPVGLSLQFDIYGLLHNMASWVWGYGGDFCSPDGKHILFDQPNALTGIKDYFNLLRYLSPHGRRLLQEQSCSDLFRHGQVGIAFDTQTLLLASPPDIPPEVSQNWRVAAFPKVSFVGGSGLVIWKHTRYEKEALELVHFLASATSMALTSKPMGVFPPRLAILNTPEFMQDPLLEPMVRGIQAGRGYHAVPLWGLIEDRLVQVLHQIGVQLLADPQADLDTVVRQYIEPAARRLNITLSQYQLPK